jgi:hypothetical protein
LLKLTITYIEIDSKAAARSFLLEFFEGAGQALPMDQLASGMLVEVLLEYARPDEDNSGASDTSDQRKRVHNLVDRILDNGPETLMTGFVEVICVRIYDWLLKICR